MPHLELPFATREQSLWRSLYYFNLYRLVVGVAFFAIGISGGQFSTFGQRSPVLFVASSLALVAIAVIGLITITRARPGFRLQAYFQFGMDAVLITLLSSASGGISSGLHLLLLVSVAAAGVVLPGRISLFYAAFGTVLALVEHGLSHFFYPPVEGSFTQVGILGIAMFSTGLMVNALAKRLREAEARARRSASNLVVLSKLNELVVASLDIGIIVVDRRGNIQLSNDKARTLLDFESAKTLKEISGEIHERLAIWQEGREEESPLQLKPHGPNIAFRFVRISDAADTSIVMFIEDLSQTERQAHHLKLAALGRLTSAVAHEIRNPLGAIGHAGQLIQESEALSTTDRRLVEIINQQSDRINSIIKSILGLSRPHMRNPLQIDLDNWLQHFKAVFMQSHDCDDNSIRISPTRQQVNVDPDQLHQIITNLCENGMRYGTSGSVSISGGRLPENGAPIIDVTNDGPEIPRELQEKIFEPFFTTENKGTGLGLFLARELCHDNNARLDYVHSRAGGQFRIQFPLRADAA